MGKLLNEPIDMQVIAAPVLNNHLQDSPELVFRVMIGIGVLFEKMSFIFKTFLIIIFTHAFLLAH
jgi:hypothetical protein